MSTDTNTARHALLTEGEVRQLLNVSRTTFWKMRHVTKSFDIPPVSLGTRSVRFRRVDVERFLGLAA